jgi:hypothetical protein
MVEKGGLLYGEGEHDGYRDFAEPVRHRRRVLGLSSSYWLIVDELTGRGSHRLQWTHHLAPGARVEPTNSGDTVQVNLENAALAFACSESAVRARVVEGQQAPIQGWVSPRYGEKHKAPVLEMTVEADLPVVALTLVRPWGGSAPSLRVERSPGTLVARIAGEEQTDLVVLNRSQQPVSLPEAWFDGALLWLRPRGARAAASQWLAADVQRLCVEEVWIEGRDHRNRVLVGRGGDVLA